MAIKVRIDYVRPRRGGDAYGISAHAIQEIVAPSETIAVGAGSVRSAVAPEFPNDDRGEEGGVFARVSCATGAVIVTEASSDPEASELAGVWVAADPVLMPIETGWRLAFIQASEQPLGAPTAAPTYAVSTAPTPSVKGGSYIWAATASNWNGAQAKLQAVGPDGVTYLDIESLGANGAKGVVIGEGAIIKLAVTGGAPVGLVSSLT